MDEFLSTVARMRQAQKDYFKTKDKNVLERSKSLERMVDKQILELLKDQEKPGDKPPFLLFPKGE